MNFIKIIFFLLFVNKNTTALRLPINFTHTHRSSLRMINDNKIINKTKSYLKLTRSNNILPTILLSFTGSYITSTNNLIPKTIVTVLTMSYSMIINDIFDYGLDKVNNPDRPLVSGKVTLYEALTLMVIILKTIDYVSYYYLPKNLQKILEIMVIIVSLYTPLLKRIPFIKNLTCASVISFAIFFSGLPSTKNRPLLYITSIYIFLGSLMNELLLDIKDYYGDKQNKIYTIPVIFGKHNTLKLCSTILRFNILFNSIILLSFYNLFIMLPFLVINFNYYFRLNKIINNNLEKLRLYNSIGIYYEKILQNSNDIKNIVNQSNIPLFMSLIYFCYIK